MRAADSHQIVQQIQKSEERSFEESVSRGVVSKEHAHVVTADAHNYVYTSERPHLSGRDEQYLCVMQQQDRGSEFD